MKRTVSETFRKARQEMRSRLIQCHDCTDYATELHHIVAIEDGGTDDMSNLMPLCRRCHKEYTSGQTIERNQLWAELSIDAQGELAVSYKGENDGINKGDKLPATKPVISENSLVDDEKPIILESDKPAKFLIETKTGSIIRGILIPNNPIEIISKGDISRAETEVHDGNMKDHCSKQ